MELTAAQRMRSSGLNIGLGAPPRLELAGQRACSSRSRVTMCPIEDLSVRLRPMVRGRGERPIFPAPSSAMRCSSSISGRRHPQGAGDGRTGVPLEIDASAREVLTEVATSCSMPVSGRSAACCTCRSRSQCRTHAGDAGKRCQLDHRQSRRAPLCADRAYRIPAQEPSSLTGYLVIVLSVASIERLIRAIERWERDPALAMPLFEADRSCHNRRSCGARQVR